MWRCHWPVFASSTPDDSKQIRHAVFRRDNMLMCCKHGMHMHFTAPDVSVSRCLPRHGLYAVTLAPAFRCDGQTWPFTLKITRYFRAQSVPMRWQGSSSPRSMILILLKHKSQLSGAPAQRCIHLGVLNYSSCCLQLRNLQNSVQKLANLSLWTTMARLELIRSCRCSSLN